MVRGLNTFVVAKLYASARAQWLAWSVVNLLLFFFTATLLFNDRGVVLADERNRLSAQALLVEKNLVEQLQSVNAALVSVERDLVHFEVASVDPQMLSRRLQSLSDALRGVRTLSVFDSKGTLLASNRTEFVGHNFAHREYFQAAQKGADPSVLYVSQPFRTATGVYSMNLVRVAPGTDGHPWRYLSATLEPEFYRTLLSSVLYADDMWTGIAHESGALAVVYPEAEEWLGRDLFGPSGLFAQHMAAGSQSTFAQTNDPFSNERVLKVLQNIDLSSSVMSKRLIVVVNRKLDSVLSPWWLKVKVAGLVLLAMAALSAGGLWLFQRHGSTVRKLQSEAEHLRQQAHDAVEQMAFVDSLTQLPNRRLLLDRLSKCLAASLRQGKYSAVFFIDLDLFKLLNDTHGHGAGDELLQQVGKRLVACVRAEDTVARFGGDEFVILLPDVGADLGDARQRAEAVARKVLNALSHEYQLTALRFSCSASVGISLFGHRSEEVAQILDRADSAMYEAKQAGRNGYRFSGDASSF